MIEIAVQVSKGSAKRIKRKDELADSAIYALKQLGYARTSLRDIAESSNVSLGMLHYYFEDKVELISYCVQKYKKDFIREMDNILQSSGNSNTVIEDFSKGLAEAIEKDAETHRLWYDIRSQAMFDESFHNVVSEIESSLIALIERLLKKLGLPESNALVVYTLLDGVFRYFLQQKLLGKSSVAEDFADLVEAQLELLRLFSSGRIRK